MAGRKDSVTAKDGHAWQQEYAPSRRGDGILQASTCSNPGAMGSRPRKSKRKDESLSSTIRKHLVDHQLGLSINALLLLAFTHVLFPSLRPITTPFFTLSHKVQDSDLYRPGPQDYKFVLTWIVIFSGLRAVAMDYVLMPWARRVGVTKKKTSVRFAEQAWMLMYYSVFWTMGMYLWASSEYFTDRKAIWNGWPFTQMSGLLKYYYLAQFAFWLQQIVVINIEDRRKDHWQMFTHHIITNMLMLASYGSYHTRVGNVILCIMDVVDLLLPAAKMMKYAGLQTACDIAFGVFIVTWFLARHVVYLAICWSLYADSPEGVPSTCYDVTTGERIGDGGSEIFWNVLHGYRRTEDPICFNEHMRWGFMGLLLALQVLTLIWLVMICRVAFLVLSGKGADDSRSDDEGEEEEEEEEEEEQEEEEVDTVSRTEKRVFPQLKGKEVGVEETRFVRRNGQRTRKSKVRASGISIPGHGDHKELLGRIGCDKPGS